jgi:hypothetical protein
MVIAGSVPRVIASAQIGPPCWACRRCRRLRGGVPRLRLPARSLRALRRQRLLRAPRRDRIPGAGAPIWIGSKPSVTVGGRRSRRGLGDPSDAVDSTHAEAVKLLHCNRINSIRTAPEGSILTVRWPDDAPTVSRLVN